MWRNSINCCQLQHQLWLINWVHKMFWPSQLLMSWPNYSGYPASHPSHSHFSLARLMRLGLRDFHKSISICRSWQINLQLPHAKWQPIEGVSPAHLCVCVCVRVHLMLHNNCSLPLAATPALSRSWGRRTCSSFTCSTCSTFHLLHMPLPLKCPQAQGQRDLWPIGDALKMPNC